MTGLTCMDPSFMEEKCRWMTPGLFDLQINGIAGINFTDASLTLAQIEQADALVRAGGVSRYCPTIISSSLDTARAVLWTFTDAWEKGMRAGAWAIHLEGPWISDLDGPRGVHRKEYVRAVSLAEWDALQEAARGRIRVLTLAPELPGALDLVRRAARSGTVVSVGHTAATAEQVALAVGAGARMSTHLFNGCARLLDRHANTVYAQLAEDALHACFIADGHHVPFATLRIGIRAKGVEKSILVSDLAPLAGLPDGEYEMEGNRVELRDGGLRVKATSLLSGAARTLREDVELLGRQTEPGIECALLMATRSPAAAVGDLPWADLRPGRRGPVAVFSWDGERLRLENRVGF
ncbi:MAG: N-acetylglucosamine-6-phosphate deacetylase [Spirochaetia bacterium]